MIKKSIKGFRLISSVALVFLLAGCNVVPPAQADARLPTDLPSNTPDISAPKTPYKHELRFDVRAGLRAQVTMSETRIEVRVNQQPSVQIHRVDFPLLRQWGTRYLKVNDYDRDGMLDLAVMTSAGRGGSNKCYAVYRYNPASGQFRQRKSFDRCNV